MRIQGSGFGRCSIEVTDEEALDWVSSSIGLVVLLCCVSLRAQKTRFGQDLPFAKPGVSYPLTVHVYGVHIRTDCQYGTRYCISVLFADVTANGRKLELRSGLDFPEKLDKETSPLSFGDFRARVLKKASGVELGDQYELVLADNRVLKCMVTGMVE